MLFGDIAGSEVTLSLPGEIAEVEWERTQAVRENVIVDSFIIMPNHIHGILFLVESQSSVGATWWVAQTPAENPEESGKPAAAPSLEVVSRRLAPAGPARDSLGAIIGQFKSVAAKRINAARRSPGLPVWQRNYYEHVIRDDSDLHYAREYIENNPLKWTIDMINPLPLEWKR